MQQLEQNATRPSINPGRVGRWLGASSPLKRSTTKALRKQVGDIDTMTLDASTSFSTTSKARGVPTWEHPKQKRNDVSSLSDAPPASPRKKQTSPPPKPLSPTLQAIQPTKRVSPKTQRREQITTPLHPSFENMVIVFNREDSDRSLGEITFDESYAYDEEYQKHQRKLRKVQQLREQNEDRTRDLDSPRVTDEATPVPTYRYSKANLPTGKTIQVPLSGSPKRPILKVDSKSKGNKYPNHSTASGGIDSAADNLRAANAKKINPVSRESEPLDGSEVSGECVSLSDLYTNWRGQTGSAASSPCTTTSRSTLPSPSSQHGGCLSIGKSNRYSAGHSVEQDDTDYIFGPEITASTKSQREYEREQEDFILNLVLQRSLEDHSSNSSVSGFSSHGTSTQGSEMHSLDTGRMAIRMQNFPATPQSGAFLSSAGCHLAMVATSNNNPGNTRTAPAMAKPSSILQAMENDSDDEEDLPYTEPTKQGQATFVWKRDTRTNRWYKKPVFAAPTEEETVLETVMQASARDALSSSMAELRLNTCRHW